MKPKIIKTKSMYHCDNYLITHYYKDKKYVVCVYAGSKESHVLFKEYFKDSNFTAKSKKEVLHNLINYSKYCNLDFNPNFKHIITDYLDNENNLKIIKYQKAWIVFEQSSVSTWSKWANTRKEAINKYLEANNLTN